MNLKTKGRDVLALQAHEYQMSWKMLIPYVGKIDMLLPGTGDG